MLTFHQEAKSKIIHLKDDHPDVVHEMIQYLYTGEFDDTSEDAEVQESIDSLLMDVLVHTISDKVRHVRLSYLFLPHFSSANLCDSEV